MGECPVWPPRAAGAGAPCRAPTPVPWQEGVRGQVWLSGVFREPGQHRLFVLIHPVDVGPCPLQRLLQGASTRPEADVLVVCLELLQLQGDRGAGTGAGTPAASAPPPDGARQLRAGQQLPGPPATRGAGAAVPSLGLPATGGLQGAAGWRGTQPWGAWVPAAHAHRPCQGPASPAAAQTPWRTAGSRIGSDGRRRRSRPRTWESREGRLSRGLPAAQAGGRDGAPTPGGTGSPPMLPAPLPPPAPMWCSLAKKKLPVAADEVPGQGLPHHVAGDAVDGGGGILLADLGGVDGVLQVPGGGEPPGEGLCKQGPGPRPGLCTHRWRIQVSVLQARAVRILSASDTMVASRNLSHMKSQAS